MVEDVEDHCVTPPIKIIASPAEGAVIKSENIPPYILAEQVEQLSTIVPYAMSP